MDAFDNLLRKLSNGYVEQFQIDCFCSESFGLFLVTQPDLARIRFGVFRSVTKLERDLNGCMLAPAMTLAAIQFQAVGYVVSWNGSQHGSTMLALNVPLIRNTIRHLLIHVWRESCVTLSFGGMSESTNKIICQVVFVPQTNGICHMPLTNH